MLGVVRVVQVERAVGSGHVLEPYKKERGGEEAVEWGAGGLRSGDQCRARKGFLATGKLQTCPCQVCPLVRPWSKAYRLIRLRAMVAMPFQLSAKVSSIAWCRSPLCKNAPDLQRGGRPGWNRLTLERLEPRNLHHDWNSTRIMSHIRLPRRPSSGGLIFPYLSQAAVLLRATQIRPKAKCLRLGRIAV